MAANRTATGNGHDERLERYEKQLAEYLQRRIKPGLNRGSIPMLSRSIAKDLAEATQPAGGGGRPSHDDDDAQHDFEADMHDLQEELGEDWVLSFSVHNGDAWLTAEKDDGSQHLEAPTAAKLVKAVKLLERGGRGG
jgi:hypothetical protein